MSLDLLWIVGGPPDAPGREELRYSIRSAVENFRFPYRHVVIAGDAPDWFGGVRIPLEPDPDKWRNQAKSLSAYLNYPGAADEVIVMNDDIYVTEPIAGPLPIYRNKARASEWNIDHATHGWGCWTCAVKACAEWMSNKAGEDIHLYECHVPLRFSVPRLRDLINEYPDGRQFMVGEAFAIAGIGGPGEHAGNAKVKAADSLDDKQALPMPYLSGNPDSWAGDLGDYIRSEYPTPSPWEKTTHAPTVDTTHPAA